MTNHLTELAERKPSFIQAIRLLLGISKCVVFGHKNSGEFYCSGRCWQRCARCGGWLGWMFHWERPWTANDARAALKARSQAGGQQ
jgi:hypothetical protein